MAEKTGCGAEIQEVVKLNGLKLQGIVIKEEGVNTAPVVYLEQLLEEYNGGADMGQIADSIIRCHEDNKAQVIVNVNDLADFEKIRGKVYPHVINREANAGLLEDVPYNDYLDLAFVYYCEMGADEIGCATFLIKNCHMEMWGITKAELEETALANSVFNKQYSITGLCDVIKELAGELPEGCMPCEKEIYVITNKEKLYGAVAIRRKDIMEHMAEMLGGDIVIIPSSVHEIMALKCSSEDIGDIRAMVHEVNRTQLTQEEFLSDNVYVYKRGGEVVIA